MSLPSLYHCTLALGEACTTQTTSVSSCSRVWMYVCSCSTTGASVLEEGSRIDKVKISPDTLEIFAKFHQAQKKMLCLFYYQIIFEESQNFLSKIFFSFYRRKINGKFYINIHKIMRFSKFRQNFAKIENFAKVFKVLPGSFKFCTFSHFGKKIARLTWRWRYTEGFVWAF